MITGFVRGQQLKLSSPLIVADTIDYLTALFTFHTRDWAGMETWTHWQNGAVVYDVPLTDDQITEDAHLNLSAGTWEVWVHGNRFEDGEVVQRITTCVDTLQVLPTGSLDGEPFPEIPASETERILARLEKLEEGGTGGGITQETDPTVPSWAKQSAKPAYTASEVGALPADTKIPAKTSDLTNDAGFITRLVSDLANYYSKSETYTQAEVNALVSAIPKFAISVVPALPTTDISGTTVYLVGGGDGTDLYTEYIYVNGAWEILGSQRVDLTGYATETWVNAKLADYLTAETLTAVIITGALGYTPAKADDVPDVDDTLTMAGAAADAAKVGEELSTLSEAIADLEVVPDYVVSEGKEVADKVIEKRTINSLVFLAASDLHVTASETVRTAIKHMGQGMAQIVKYVTPDCIAFFGDYNYNTTPSDKAQGIEDMKYCRKCVGDVVGEYPSVWMVGNHDYYSTSTSDTENRLSEDEVYALVGSHNTNNAVVDVDNLGRDYGYIDFPKQKIRLVYLNTTDIAGVDYTSHLISTVQGQWFVNTALDLSDKGDDEENWGVVVCSHVPLFDNPQVPVVLGNFVDRGSGSNFGMTYSFANAKAELIAVFHGHIHNFKVNETTTPNGNTITYICIPNAVPGRENPYTVEDGYKAEYDDGIAYTKTAGTAEDTSFNVIVIDRDNNKIHAICYGAGVDREVTYSAAGEGPEVEIINQIPISTDASGEIYNGVGYADGVRIGSDGTDRTGASVDATGFIPCTKGDVLYFSGCEILVGTNVNYQELVFYDGEKGYLGTAYLYQEPNLTISTVKYDDNNNLLSYDTSEIAYDFEYVRLSGNYIGEGSVITVNQPLS